jgi:flagellar biogenesis protein FliO
MHQRREETDMNGLIWTIFAVIGMIVVIGWIVGRL